jgi:hypothetical protein
MVGPVVTEHSSGNHPGPAGDWWAQQDSWPGVKSRVSVPEVLTMKDHI